MLLETDYFALVANAAGRQLYDEREEWFLQLCVAIYAGTIPACWRGWLHRGSPSGSKESDGIPTVSYQLIPAII